MPKLLKPSPLQLLDSVSLCIVQFISPVVTHCLTRCLCPCRCFGGWTRSWHRGSISPQSTGSSLTLSTPRSASHALHHPYPCHDANCNSGVTLQCRSTAQKGLHLGIVLVQPPSSLLNSQATLTCKSTHSCPTVSMLPCLLTHVCCCCQNNCICSHRLLSDAISSFLLQRRSNLQPLFC